MPYRSYADMISQIGTVLQVLMKCCLLEMGCFSETVEMANGYGGYLILLQVAAREVYLCSRSGMDKVLVL